jgi:hypothetical protein
VTDFESALKRLLSDNVDAMLGPRRPAPQLDLSAAARGRRGFRPWVVPLLAAAGVAAAIAAIVVPAQLVADRPAGGTNNGSLIAPPSNPAYPAPENSDPSQSPPSPIPPAGAAVDLGGAKLRLPVGWVAREVADPHQYGSSVYSREWCLAPAGSSGQPRADCPLQFGPAASVTTSGVSVNGYVPLGNRLGGTQSSCPVSGFLGETGWGMVGFGKRDGFDREWHGNCSDGPLWIKQYVVDTAPGYLLFSDQVTPELNAAMTEISAHALLPAQTAPLLLYDLGTVRSVTPRPDGYLMTIVPVMREGGAWMPSGAATRSYLISSADLQNAAVGTRVGVTTDGTKVVSIGPAISGY